MSDLAVQPRGLTFPGSGVNQGAVFGVRDCSKVAAQPPESEKAEKKQKTGKERENPLRRRGPSNGVCF